MDKSKAAAVLGRLGGFARAKNLSKEELSEQGSHAALSRWAYRPWWKETISGLLSNRKLEIKDGQYYGFAPSDELLDIEQLAARLQVPKSTIYELCRHRSRIKGTQLPSFKIGRRLKFRWSAVCDWISMLEKAGK